MAEDTPAPAVSAEARRMIREHRGAASRLCEASASVVACDAAEGALSVYVAGLEADVALRCGPPTPRMVAAAWRAFRGDRKGQLLGLGPAFVEAIAAAFAEQEKPDGR